MMNWVKLAENILDSEFPSFGVCMHLATALKIYPKLERIPQQSLKSLKELGAAFNVDAESRLCLMISATDHSGYFPSKDLNLVVDLRSVVITPESLWRPLVPERD